MRREDIKRGISNGKHAVLSTNIYSRQTAANSTNNCNKTIYSFKTADLTNKQINAAHMYQFKKEA
jgi:hypothetical protein